MSTELSHRRRRTAGVGHADRSSPPPSRPRAASDAVRQVTAGCATSGEPPTHASCRVGRPPGAGATVGTPTRTAECRPDGRRRRTTPTRPVGDQQSRLDRSIGAIVVALLLVAGGVFIRDVARTTTATSQRASQPRRPRAEVQAGGSRSPTRASRATRRRPLNPTARSGSSAASGRRRSQRTPRGIRPRHRQLEGRRRPARSGSARDGGDLAGQPGGARRLEDDGRQTGRAPTRSGEWSTVTGWSCRTCCSPGRRRPPRWSATASSSPAGWTPTAQLLNTTEIFDGNYLDPRRPDPDSAAAAGRGLGRQAGVRGRRSEREHGPGCRRGLRPGREHLDGVARPSPAAQRSRRGGRRRPPGGRRRSVRRGRSSRAWRCST